VTALEAHAGVNNLNRVFSLLKNPPDAYGYAKAAVVASSFINRNHGTPLMDYFPFIDFSWSAAAMLPDLKRKQGLHSKESDWLYSRLFPLEKPEGRYT
jgi:hypothetical protein